MLILQLMPQARKQFLFFLSSTALFFISIVALFTIEIGHREPQDQVLELWTTPIVASATIENAGSISTDLIVEKTDFTRKVIQVFPGVSRQAAAEAVAKVGGQLIEEAGQNAFSVALPEENLAQAEQELANDQNIAVVETDYAVSFLATADWGVERVKAPEVWDETQGNGILVAVVDTGVDRSHSDIAANYAGGYDFFNDDTDPQDDHGHGTAMTGIALAPQNNFGTIGVGHQARLLAAKVLGSDGIGYVSTVVAGIDWAVDNGASVINLSLGTTHNSQILKDAVDRAARQGVVVVAAAGNTNGGALVYPAAYDSTIAIGATDRDDRLASFSAVGSELVAPGVGILAPSLGGAHITVSGTSASTAHVSGLAALLLEYGVGNVRQSLRDGAVDLGTEGRDPYFGYGLPEAPRALMLAEEDTTSPTVSFIEPRDGQKIAGQVVVRVHAEDDREVLKVDLYANGQLVSASATYPYRWRWDVSQTPTGFYTITARALDAIGNIAEASIRVEVVRQTSDIPTPPVTTPTPELPMPAPTSTPQTQQEVQQQPQLPSSAIEKIPQNTGRPANPPRGRPN